MTEFDTNERVLKSDVTPEECKKIEKILRSKNISYFERWKTHKGIFKIFDNPNNAKCDIYVHMDSYEEAKNSING